MMITSVSIVSSITWDSTSRSLMRSAHGQCCPNHTSNSHTAHTALALWYLGADSEALKAAYTSQSTYQRPSFTSPNAITRDNWTEYLGDDKFVFI